MAEVDLTTPVGEPYKLSTRVQVVPDRRRAIEAVLAQAGRGDGVLIATEGGSTSPILDRSVVDRWLRFHRPDARRRSA